MLLLNYSLVNSISIFFSFTYTMLVFSLVIYTLPILLSAGSTPNFMNKSRFHVVYSNNVHLLLVTPMLVLLLLLLTWSAPSISIWFGHLVFSNFQLKSLYLIIMVGVMHSLVLASTSYLSSREIYDYIISTLSMFYWLSLLFMSNSIITTIFIIEVQSALLFLLIVTSSFSSTFYYRNLDFSDSNFFSNQLPYSFINSILYFFWISLISSLNLFLFTILLYQKLFTLDWYLLEHVFMYVTLSSSYKELYSIGLVWFILLFSIFTKCGISPFFIWKPTFFKGIPMHFLFFYICFFYFLIFVFFIHLLTSYLHFMTSFFSFILLSIVMFGILVLLTILAETFYIKTFLAVSRLNSLLVFLAMSSTHSFDLSFFL